MLVPCSGFGIDGPVQHFLQLPGISVTSNDSVNFRSFLERSTAISH